MYVHVNMQKGLEPSMSRQWTTDDIARAKDYIISNKSHMNPDQIDFLCEQFANNQILTRALNIPPVRYPRELEVISGNGALTSDIYQYLMSDTFPKALEPQPSSESRLSNQGFEIATDQTMTPFFQPGVDNAEYGADQTMNAEYDAVGIDDWNPDMATPPRKKPSPPGN
jgi:hypothetical protein